MKENDLIICKVEKVTNTITFVRLPSGEQGTIISSEIASGRIKFMRDYVVPNKQIVCKVLKIENDHIHLSLRRVSSKERKEAMSSFKQGQAIQTAFKQILGEDFEQVYSNITEEFENIKDFAEKAKEDFSLVEQFIPKEKIEAIKKTLERKTKESILKQNIKISCSESDGIKKIKEIFDMENKNASVTYISAGNFKLKLKVKDFKSGKQEMQKLIEDIEEKAKENNCEFFASEEK